MTTDRPADESSTIVPVHDAIEAAQWFSRTARELLEAPGRTATLQRVVELAAEVVGAPYAAVIGLDSQQLPTLFAATALTPADAIVAALREAGGGPAWQALREHRTVLVDDLTLDDRWPQYRAVVLRDTDVRSVLAFALEVGEESLAALVLYSGQSHAFGEQEQRLAAVFADHATVALSEAVEADHAANLENALDSSRTIGAALGILMERHHVTADDAFAMLRRTSQNLNRKVYELAEDVVLTGQFPPAG